MLSKLVATTLLLPLTALSSPLQHAVLSTRELPASVGTVTQFRYSGNGCTQGSNSVARSGGWVSQTYKFSQFEADTTTAGTPTTENCELHFQGAGLSPGWQVSLAEADVTGKLALAPDAKVNYYWQVYWSDDAADTRTLQGSIDNTGGKNKITNNNYTVRANVTDSLWSQCIGADGNPGILNVNFRVAVVGDGSSFDVDTETLNYKFRRC
ncbi:hypothetical protein UCDDA912_g02155 [Diaporthe ampelina]|uniref:Secreted protein n=1 Tax=Diaporthe ampelina TaxID=1214573 RepID=A0A0G2FUV2_9PEZI|nr:hypothetical protein UCDDA912_g02155 [Diaporthe ampelina]